MEEGLFPLPAIGWCTALAEERPHLLGAPHPRRFAPPWVVDPNRWKGYRLSGERAPHGSGSKTGCLFKPHSDQALDGA